MSATLEHKEDSFRAESDIYLSKPSQTQNTVDPAQLRPKLAQKPDKARPIKAMPTVPWPTERSAWICTM